MLMKFMLIVWLICVPKAKGKILCDSDMFIAGIAISNNLIVVTNNEKHFGRIKNLKIENWTL